MRQEILQFRHYHYELFQLWLYRHPASTETVHPTPDTISTNQNAGEHTLRSVISPPALCSSYQRLHFLHIKNVAEQTDAKPGGDNTCVWHYCNQFVEDNTK